MPFDAFMDAKQRNDGAAAVLQGEMELCNLTDELFTDLLCLSRVLTLPPWPDFPLASLPPFFPPLAGKLPFGLAVAG
jgi:hypothetical protein